MKIGTVCPQMVSSRPQQSTAETHHLDRVELGIPLDDGLMPRRLDRLSQGVAAKNRRILAGQTGADDFYQQQLAPAIRSWLKPEFRSQEEEIARLEGCLLEWLDVNGVSALPSFALRGIGCSSLGDNQVPDEELYQDRSLGSYRRRGYISEAGGNFFVFHPETSRLTPDDFLYLLFASSGSTSRYASNDDHPVVLMVAMDEQFRIPASGGNDGISGTFPWTAEIDSQRCHFFNLEVGCITRSGTKQKTGLVCDTGVPRQRVRAEIGSQGLPDWIEGVGIWERTPQQEVALARYVYGQILEELVSSLPSEA